MNLPVFDFPIDDPRRRPVLSFETDGEIYDVRFTPKGMYLIGDIFSETLRGSLLFSWISWRQEYPSAYPQRWSRYGEALKVCMQVLRERYGNDEVEDES